MKKTMYVMMMLSIILFASCDQHEIEDLSWHSWKAGMVYSTNGDVTTYENCIEKGNKPEAVLFYIDYNNEISGIAYAVTLKDCEAGAFIDPDTIPVAQNTSADAGSLDGESNTTSLRYGQISSPIAQNVSPKYFIPSVGEMYKLYAARSIVNSTISQCGGDILPVDAENCWYWTSTEQEGAVTDRAWRFSLYSGRYESEDKHNSHPTRPIMMIRLNKAEQN